MPTTEWMNHDTLVVADSVLFYLWLYVWIFVTTTLYATIARVWSLSVRSHSEVGLMQCCYIKQFRIERERPRATKQGKAESPNMSLVELLALRCVLHEENVWSNLAANSKSIVISNLEALGPDSNASDLNMQPVIVVERFFVFGLKDRKTIVYIGHRNKDGQLVLWIDSSVAPQRIG